MYMCQNKVPKSLIQDKILNDKKIFSASSYCDGVSPLIQKLI